MWVFFEDGTFYSAVLDKKDKNVKWVRMRDRRSADLYADWLELERGTEVQILTWEHRDYAYRIKSTPAEWTQYVTFQTESSEATNFKDEVKHNLGPGHEFLDTLGNVWSVMFNYQYDLEHPRKAQFSKGRGDSLTSYELLSDEELDDIVYDGGTDDDGWVAYQDWLQRNS